MNNPTIIIGTPTRGLSITICRRIHPDCTDYWDGNWLSATVNVVVGGFRGRVEAYLRAEEFVAFRDQVMRIYELLRGQAEFHTMEGWIAVHMEVDKTGHIRCDAFVMDDPGIGNRLTFSLELDQSYLPEMLCAIDAIINAFPVIGVP